MNRLFSSLLLSFVFLSACGGNTDSVVTDENSTHGTEPLETTRSALCTELSPSPHLPAGDVLSLAQQESVEAYQFTKEQGAEIIPVDENRSYAVWWQPEDFDVDTDIVLVSLHGHGEWAVKDFEVWHPTLSERNYAYLGVQWWFGRSLETEGYYTDDQIYSIIQNELAAKGVPAEHVIFQGFSMGGARSYGVTLYDKQCGGNYFGVSIANAGPWEDGYPLYARILDGEFGETPFKDTRWVLFCGEQDINEYAKTSTQANVCESMDHTQDVLTELGGTVDLLLKDPQGDHGSFMMNASNTKTGLDAAEVVMEQILNR